MSRLGNEILRQLAAREAEERRPLLPILLLAARENGVTIDQVERGLGKTATQDQIDRAVELLRDSGIQVSAKRPSLLDLPVSGLPSDVLEALDSIGIKTWRALFVSNAADLYNTTAFAAPVIYDIDFAAKRAGYRLGMTPEQVERRAAELEDAFATPIEKLPLSVRALNTLSLGGAYTLGDICARTKDSMKGIPRLGALTLTEIETMLEKRGLRFNMIVPGHGA